MKKINNFVRSFFNAENMRLNKVNIPDKDKCSKENNMSIDKIVTKFIETCDPHFVSIKKAPDNAIYMVMAGICLGDIIGMPYEGWGIPTNENPDTIPLLKNSCSFTDDSIMSLAVLEATMRAKQLKLENVDNIVLMYKSAFRYYAKLYPDGGYGFHFFNWAVLDQEDEQYTSFGDGSAMRAGILGAMFLDSKSVIKYAVLSAIPTHSHEEGIKGAVVTAVCVWMALHGAQKEDILSYACKHYPDGYRKKEEKNEKLCMSPDITVKELIKLQPSTASVICQDAVPEAISNFIHSDSYEECIRNTLRYQCDSDTVGAISGGIAAAFYGNCDLPSIGKESISILEDICGLFWERISLVCKMVNVEEEK